MKTSLPPQLFLCICNLGFPVQQDSVIEIDYDSNTML